VLVSCSPIKLPGTRSSQSFLHVALAGGSATVRGLISGGALLLKFPFKEPRVEDHVLRGVFDVESARSEEAHVIDKGVTPSISHRFE